MSSPFANFLAQVSNTVVNPASPASPANPANVDPNGGSMISTVLTMVVMGVLVYFLFFRPQMQAKKKQDDTIKGAKTGDKVITSSGIHGFITNVKENTVIVKVHDNVKLEIEKSHIDKITRAADVEKEVKV